MHNIVFLYHDPLYHTLVFLYPNHKALRTVYIAHMDLFKVPNQSLGTFGRDVCVHFPVLQYSFSLRWLEWHTIFQVRSYHGCCSTGDFNFNLLSNDTKRWMHIFFYNSCRLAWHFHHLLHYDPFPDQSLPVQIPLMKSTFVLACIERHWPFWC